MNEAGTDHRGGLKRSLNEFGAVGLFFATLLGPRLEAESADRPASLAADEPYTALQTSDAAPNRSLTGRLARARLDQFADDDAGLATREGRARAVVDVAGLSILGGKRDGIE
jgi:hypothetical protein